jgi:hypothetical protein
MRKDSNLVSVSELRKILNDLPDDYIFDVWDGCNQFFTIENVSIDDEDKIITLTIDKYMD